MNDEKELAYSVVRKNLENEIANLVELTKKATIKEAEYMLYNLRILRIQNPYLEEENKRKTQLLKNVSSIYEEVFKYLAQLILKYGNLHSEPIPKFNIELAKEIIDKGTLVNTIFDSLSVFTLFEGDFQGDEGVILKPNLSEKGKSFFDYFCRIERDSLLKAQDLQKGDDFISKFDNEYVQYKDLIENHFEIEYKKFIEFYQYIINYLRRKYKVMEQHMPRQKDGIVSVDNYTSFIMFSSSSYIPIETLERRFGQSIINFINKLVFNPDEFDEIEGLRYHSFSRKPLIKSDNKLYLSPELILDSMHINSHYSLLESSKKISEAYKQRSSNYFVDDIAKLARNYGYKEVGRELDLFEGKQAIGDIDLILKNHEGHYLLIEAKKHALPLDVYFKDVAATEKRLEDLKTGWEKKVLKRTKHLNEHYSRYTIDKNFTYIIVSQNPEIISHFSNLMILSFLELEKWLQQKHTNFNELYKDLYELNGYTEEEFEQLYEDKLTIFKKMTH
ncbi:hypothetical protein [Bacillus thuringiensis]|uniref:Uncharacterized protein n=1 Tax=Bacillus thuringiensis serovar yosoo TaxID=180848 RepID=A0A9X6FAK6_BACTU|nr:hypothetical protein [Bacillus thuringiensis]OTY60347.1 hypothetical protein BK746_08010 [Bacillus thuringiensis serovar yosoo]